MLLNILRVIILSTLYLIEWSHLLGYFEIKSVKR
jgi:hypothetical protein